MILCCCRHAAHEGIQKSCFKLKLTAESSSVTANEACMLWASRSLQKHTASSSRQTKLKSSRGERNRRSKNGWNWLMNNDRATLIGRRIDKRRKEIWEILSTPTNIVWDVDWVDNSKVPLTRYDSSRVTVSRLKQRNKKSQSVRRQIKEADRNRKSIIHINDAHSMPEGMLDAAKCRRRERYSCSSKSKSIRFVYNFCLPCGEFQWNL